MLFRFDRIRYGRILLVAGLHADRLPRPGKRTHSVGPARMVGFLPVSGRGGTDDRLQLERTEPISRAKILTSPQPDTDTGRLTLHSGKPAAAPGHARAPKPNDDGSRRFPYDGANCVEATHRAAVTSRKDASAALLCGFSDFPRGDVRRKPHRFSPSYRLSCRFDSCRSDQNPELPDTNRHAHSLRYARTAETRNRRRQNTRRPDPQSARQSAEESGPPHGRLYAKGDQDDLRIRSGRNPAHQKRNGHPEAGRTRPGGHYFRADQSRSKYESSARYPITTSYPSTSGRKCSSSHSLPRFMTAEERRIFRYFIKIASQ